MRQEIWNDLSPWPKEWPKQPGRIHFSEWERPLLYSFWLCENLSCFQGKAIGRKCLRGVRSGLNEHAPYLRRLRWSVVLPDPGYIRNAVMIDHGVGLFSLYGHIDHQCQNGPAGQKRGCDWKFRISGLGRGRIHLPRSHCGQQFVNPQEWWDPHWIAKRDQKNSYGKLSGLKDSPSWWWTSVAQILNFCWCPGGHAARQILILKYAPAHCHDNRPGVSRLCIQGMRTWLSPLFIQRNEKFHQFKQIFV